MQFLHRGGLALVGMVVITGCVTTKDLDQLRTYVNNQVSVIRNDTAQSRQAVEALKVDVTLLKSLGIAVDSLKSQLEGMQATIQALQTDMESHRTTLDDLRIDFKEFKVAHEGVAKETDRLRMSVVSLEQGMMHQLQIEVTLARERIKQLEHMIERLQQATPPEKEKEGSAAPKL
jgi:outer membrane murein-binding lipoprotein Lpp